MGGGGGTADGPASHDIGFVLEHSEHVWYRCPAAYQCTSVSWIDQRISHWGYRASAYEVTTPRMVSLGMSDWLVTERRLATRQSDGQVISIYWTALAGLIVDLVAERVVLEGVDGYHGALAEPGIAPMAVAAIAACHGPHALLDHPALASLRSSEEGSTARRRCPPTEWLLLCRRAGGTRANGVNSMRAGRVNQGYLWEANQLFEADPDRQRPAPSSVGRYEVYAQVVNPLPTT